MTDEYLRSDGDSEHVDLRITVNREVLDRLTTAAATQGMNLTTAINTAMEFYEVALSAPEERIVRVTDADDVVRRFYVIPTGSDHSANALLLGILIMVLSGPAVVFSAWFFGLWLLGAALAFLGWSTSVARAVRR